MWCFIDEYIDMPRSMFFPSSPLVFTQMLKNAQPRGKIAPGTFKFIISPHFSESISNLPPSPGVG